MWSLTEIRGKLQRMEKVVFNIWKYYGLERQQCWTKKPMQGKRAQILFGGLFSPLVVLVKFLLPYFFSREMASYSKTFHPSFVFVVKFSAQDPNLSLSHVCASSLGAVTGSCIAAPASEGSLEYPLHVPQMVSQGPQNLKPTTRGQTLHPSIHKPDNIRSSKGA